MSGLVKATLQRMKQDKGDQVEGDPIPVQFNPSSLRLTLSNQPEGGASRGRQRQEYTGKTSTELSLELVFDTADEAKAGGEPVSVRDRIRQVEQFVLPVKKGESRLDPPPRVRFTWGETIVTGVTTSLTVDLDLFAPDGTPLRGKVTLSIHEQDPLYTLTPSENGTAPSRAAPASPGHVGDSPGDRSAQALDGESAADFAARVGLDPAAWRGVAAGLGGSLSLSAGVEVGFSASLDASLGLGASVGFEADLGLSLEASLGLEASAGFSAGAAFSASAELSAGFALSAAGGVQAAIGATASAKAGAAAATTARAFGRTGVAASAAVGASASFGASASASVSASSSVSTSSVASASAPRSLPSSSPASAGAVAAGRVGSRAALSAAVPAGSSAARTLPASASRYAPIRPDPRAVSWGFGVPLRPRVGAAAEARAGVVALRPYERPRETPVTRDPTAPPWTRLPAPAGASSGTSSGGRPAPGGRRMDRIRGGRDPLRLGCGCGCGESEGRGGRRR